MLNTATAAAPQASFRRPQLLGDANGGVEALTISASEMCRLSGVGRERLRTWERRHGFPTPVRAANGVRRYHAEDVRKVVAVARLVDRGTLLEDAIGRVLDGADDAEPTMSSLGAALDHAPAPAIAITGPAPLTIAWANAETIKAPEAPQVGADLLEAVPEFGPAAVSAIQRLMTGDERDVAVIHHTDWVGTFPAERHSLAWRLPPEASREAVVVLVQLPEEISARGVSPAGAEAGPWAAAVSQARRVVQSETGVASVQRAVGEVARATGAMEAFIATCHGGKLRAATSVRGTYSARTLPLDMDCDAVRAMADGEIDWLCAQSLQAIGAPPRSQAMVVPMIAGGDTIGGIFLLYPSELRLCDLSRELLVGLGALLGTTLQREHHAALSHRPARHAAA